ncbi:Sensor protein KdpD [Paraconexibacter sp. AEG42_29]|uniref:Sensor protein KdpD n=1 Tax=Paraconexibacter sp. AEG42_29 TaxID=2997339 RepID=A0AAU7AQQ7_9ACTN
MGEDAGTVGRRGHLTIYLGMAPGVGKTFRMLQDGHAALAAGRDVVVGVVESHGRAETAALVAGLPVLPRRTLVHRGVTLDELDLPGLLTRAPALCLVDELAHTNAPGTEHPKRHDDVEALVAAGIDVLSTVNVQHLESLNDQVAELSGVRVRETFPDAVLGRADEVVLIDLTPEALLARLRDGKVYPAARIAASLNGFFRIENLAALREVALRQVAEEVESRRLVTGAVGTRTQALARDTPQAVGERLLALVEPVPAAQRLVRRAWRSAQRLGADLDLLWVAPPAYAGGRADGEVERQLGALRQLASLLGATFLVEASGDVAGTVAAVARTRGTTYILLGRSRPARGLGRLATPLPQRLMSALPAVDVRIVADRSTRHDRTDGP